jgi:hypothetical protein
MKRSPLNRKPKRAVHAAYDPHTPFPKPKDIPVAIGEAFKTYPDGREVCFTQGRVGIYKGRREYQDRIYAMCKRQNFVCCLYGICPTCPGDMAFVEATFEHENGRGAGKRDDRIELPDGRWINGAAHYTCNTWKGSRRIDYNLKPS